MENLYQFKATTAAGQTSASLQEQFTPRQLDVLALLCEGLPNKLIGRRLNIACGTVKIHVMQILRVLNVSSRLQAVVAVRSLGIACQSGDVQPALRDSVAAPRTVTPLRLPLVDKNKSRPRAMAVTADSRSAQPFKTDQFEFGGNTHPMAFMRNGRQHEFVG